MAVTELRHLLQVHRLPVRVGVAVEPGLQILLAVLVVVATAHLVELHCLLLK
jgi:hypothetical protein